ncbi:MAG: UPF0175 family protein [Candidatus Aenigmatarchaeota archaeon]
MKFERVSLTLPGEMLEKSDKIAKERKEDRSTIMRELLSRGLNDYLEKSTIKLYSNGVISLGKASEIAGVSVWKFIDLLKENKVAIKYDIDDMKKDMV